ncbi:hypothetical protein C0081_15475 [Cohaesibacter celericrescens]|uniref:Uncharacterized protein n=1 Tax=Cohaesibacter celericrescens TaxID=2067669 RepID=A0A2N5XP73_9HYPH|nr:hypothetical protein C0081_15475 [Cohaesibacter celericrescens]
MFISPTKLWFPLASEEGIGYEKPPVSGLRLRCFFPSFLGEGLRLKAIEFSAHVCDQIIGMPH